MLYQSVSLPQWVYRVNSCPDPKNISQWIEASKRLNCYHNLTSSNPTEQERIFHCLPSSFLNETVEFCSRSVPIESGNCPVYSYEFGTSTTPISYNCTAFISGCPTAMFKSKEIYKFPKCLKLNRKLRCFEAERNCTSVLVMVISNRETNAEKLVTLFICIFSILAVVRILLYPFLSSNELTSEEKLSFSVLQHSFSPKLNNSWNVSCKGDPNDLKCIEIMTSNRVKGVLMKDDRCE